MQYKRIKEIRVDNDIKQQTIAKILNITQQQYSLYEKGIREFPIEFIIKLAQYYNVSTDYLLELTNRPNPYPKD